jgi:glycosyltransferase involved in cell wall biosynthesis
MTGVPESVLFICDFPPGFTGAAHHYCGVGGTEALVVVLAETLAAWPMLVTVAARMEQPCQVRDVCYVPVAAARTVAADVTVLVKQWSDAAGDAKGIRMFLATDVHVPDPAGLARSYEWSSVQAALSPYMRGALAAIVDVQSTRILPPPIDLREYADVADQRDRIMLYCSVPDRGLYYLKDLFPAIRRRVSGAKLVITSDFTLWGRPAARDAFMRFFDGQPDVEYLGHVDRDRLVAEQRRARVLAYPCLFPEGFCIAAAECMAAGAVPVTTHGFALTTTVGDDGVLIKGRPRSWFYRRRFVKAAAALLADDQYWRERSLRCRHRARMWDAPRVADAFLAMLPHARDDR